MVLSYRWAQFPKWCWSQLAWRGTRQHSAEQGREAPLFWVPLSTLPQILFLDFIWNWYRKVPNHRFLDPSIHRYCSWTPFESDPKTGKTSFSGPLYPQMLFLDFIWNRSRKRWFHPIPLISFRFHTSPLISLLKSRGLTDKLTSNLMVPFGRGYKMRFAQ